MYLLRLDLPEEQALSAFRGAVRALVICQGLQASLVYRLGHAVIVWEPETGGGRLLRRLARAAHFVCARTIESTTGIRINERADIGPGLHIAHHGTTIIGAVTMGANATITHSVTIGRSGRRGERATPVIGDRVWIGPGAVITGGLHIGDDVVIGANAVVTKSLPDAAVAYGAPARIASYRGSFDQVLYAGAEDDPGRVRAVARAAERTSSTAAQEHGARSEA
ncbi:serine O-acetyltransferase [Motilibacter rhizosphaerae]|uniref:Serine acetyltransferase n=1 Tax=Motilibacter rhizosphaerae TaxID=598652 RepID=A0A4Q7NYV9_9ACTN|nr:serine acetyltransferase [Motilibacter rhizosphaerae]RZS91602.1 serine O-acetyltransferase [Motilibacter rhizosphaerae]